MAVDPIHDEIVAPNPFAQALLFFPGDAQGDQKPIRIIQGPKTLMGGAMDTDNVAIDPVANEVYTTQRSSDSILVFSSRANGDVAPVRILHGPKTGLRYPRRVTVDPVNKLLAVTSAQGILIFNSTDDGDVTPRCIISGPKTGIAPRLDRASNSKALLYPDTKMIVFSGGREKVDRGLEGQRIPPFTAVWNYGDCGDVPPLYKLVGAGGGAFDLVPESKELVIAHDNRLEFYSMPEIF